MKKRKLIVILLTAVTLAAVIAGIAIVKSKKEVTPHEMLERFEAALGDEYKKQTETAVVATLVYSDKTEENKINYHVLKTTYFEADPADVTGLNVDALQVLFDPDCAESCQEMKIQDWDAALYKTSSQAYLCWTYSPEVSYVLEYNPDRFADEEIIKMAESVEPIKNE